MFGHGLLQRSLGSGDRQQLSNAQCKHGSLIVESLEKHLHFKSTPQVKNICLLLVGNGRVPTEPSKQSGVYRFLTSASRQRGALYRLHCSRKGNTALARSFLVFAIGLTRNFQSSLDTLF